MKPLSKDLTRCNGDSCPDKNRCKRYMTQVIDDTDGLYSYMSNMRTDTALGAGGTGDCRHFILVS
jgi:hypothetical protein